MLLSRWLKPKSSVLGYKQQHAQENTCRSQAKHSLRMNLVAPCRWPHDSKTPHPPRTPPTPLPRTVRRGKGSRLAVVSPACRTQRLEHVPDLLPSYRLASRPIATCLTSTRQHLAQFPSLLPGQPSKHARPPCLAPLLNLASLLYCFLITTLFAAVL